MIRRLLSVVAVAMTVPMLACAELSPVEKLPAGRYQTDQSHTSVTWKVGHLGLSNYTARFTKVQASLNIDPAHPEKSTLVAEIDPTSIRTDYPEPEKKDFDKELAQNPKWFNASQFPKITFTATKVERTGDKTAKVHGDLAFLGVTKPVILDTVFNGGFEKKPFSEVAALGFSAKTTIKRSAWGMNNYVPMIADDVEVIIEAEFTQVP